MKTGRIQSGYDMYGYGIKRMIRNTIGAQMIHILKIVL